MAVLMIIQKTDCHTDSLIDNWNGYLDSCADDSLNNCLVDSLCGVW